MDTIIQQVAAKAIITNQAGQILLLRESAADDANTKVGRYDLVGGRIERGEAFLDGLAREVLEETGLTVTVGAPVFVGEWRPVIKGVQHQIIGIFMACQLADGELRLSKEHDHALWVSPQDCGQYDIVQQARDAIAAYLQHPHLR